MLALWRILLGKPNAGDKWLASGIYLSEQATQRIARDEAQK